MSERRRALQPRQRTLLIAIHGEQSLRELKRQFQALGDVGALVDELERNGLIEAAGAGAPLRVADVAATPVPPSREADEVLAVQRARQFMNETAVAALGLRAFLFTLKLEKCYTKADLEALMPEYRRVMGKARDTAFAEAMAERVEGLLS